MARLFNQRPKQGSFWFKGERPVGDANSDALVDIFWSHKGPVIQKWVHYLPVYEKYLERYKGSPVRVLEIGVSMGGSLDVWRDFFGPEAVIFGIDIDPECAKFNDKSGQVRIGSQDDPEFLASVIKEMGGVDLVLDDGSHRSSHIRASFNVLFPLLTDGGTYVIEDLHAAYWAKFGGGYKKRNSFFTDIFQMVHDLHHWHHFHGQKIAPAADNLASIHIHDSIVVLDKSEQTQPKRVNVGTKD
jgi:hypothetical protein